MTLNLVQHREGPSIWERRAASDWDAERWLLGMLGGALFVTGLRRGSVAGLLLALGGASLGCWATTGRDARKIRRAQLKQVWPRRPGADDVVGEASEESFPASDAPAFTPSTKSR